MKKSTSINIIVAIAYLLLIGLLVFEVFGLSNRYNAEEIELITEIERKMKYALEEESDEVMIQEFSKIVDEYSLDVVITRDDEVIYNTIPYTPGENLLNRMHTNAVARQSQGHFERGDEELFMWYSIYRLSNSQFINQFLLIIVSIILLLSALIILTIFLITKNLLKPFKKIQSSIERVNQYDYDDLDESDDKINESFGALVKQVDIDMTNADSQHTELEHRLQLKKQNLKNILNISNLMIDHIAERLENQKDDNISKISSHQNNPEYLEVLKYNIQSDKAIHKELLGIQEMLQNSQGFDIKEEDVELIGLLMKVVGNFHNQMYAKGLMLDYDGPENFIIKSEETTLILLLNNILMNMVLYAKEDTYLKVVVDDSDDQITMHFINESETQNIERMKNSELLFNSIENTEKEDYVYSSGNGLYITKELTRILGGEYTVSTQETTVSIKIQFFM